MPVVPYYLGRPARIWIAAMSRRSSARQARKGGGLVRHDIPGPPAADPAEARLPIHQTLPGTSSPVSGPGHFIVVDTMRPHERWEPP
jgi:hypothetical protein